MSDDLLLQLPEGPVRDALEHLERLYIPTKAHEWVMAQLQRVMQAATVSGRHKGVVLIGRPGTGKSAAMRRLERWLRERLKLHASAPSPLPIALVTAEATHKALLSSILTALGDPLAGSGTAAHMFARILRFVRELGVKGLVLDEFQHTFAGKTATQARAVTQTLKNLVNSLEIPVILVGIPSIEFFIQTSDELSQRFKRTVRLTDLTLRDKKDAKELVAMLRTLDSVIPLASDCKLESSEMLPRLLLASSASFGSLVDLVKRSCEIAAFGRREVVSINDFSAAFRESSTGPGGTVDPFVAPLAEVHAALSRLMATKPAEPGAAHE